MILTLLSATFLAAPLKPVELTIYSNGVGYVHEERLIALEKGAHFLRVGAIPQSIQQDSFSLEDAVNPGALKVLESSLSYNPLSSSGLMKAMVGKAVTLVTANGSEIKGTMLVAPGGVDPYGTDGTSTYSGMVLKGNDGKVYVNPTGTLVLSSIPDGFTATPTMLCKVDSKVDGSRPMSLQYLTGGINWSANYVLNLDEGSMEGALDARAIISNNSGLAYKDVVLRLLAGSVNTGGSGIRPMVMAQSMAKASADMSFAVSPISDYYVYQLNRPASIPLGGQQSYELFSGNHIAVQKVLRFDWGQNFGQMEMTGMQHADVILRFRNNEKNNLSYPMPAGIVRVYQHGTEGNVFLGAANINHTPEGDDVNLVVGSSFDVEGSHELAQTQLPGQLSPAFSATVKDVLRNRSDRTITVQVFETVGNNYIVTYHSEPYVKVGLNRIEFEIKMPPKTERTINLTYKTG